MERYLRRLDKYAAEWRGAREHNGEKRIKRRKGRRVSDGDGRRYSDESERDTTHLSDDVGGYNGVHGSPVEKTKEGEEEEDIDFSRIERMMLTKEFV